MSVSYKNDIASMGPEHGVIKKRSFKEEIKNPWKLKA